MEQSLKLGIPDDEAATAPSQKYTLSERKSKWLSRLLVPFSLGIWGFFANRLVATELKEARIEPEPPKPVSDGQDNQKPVKFLTADVSEDAMTSGIKEAADNVVSFSDHPITTARSFQNSPEAGESLDFRKIVDGLRGRGAEKPQLGEPVEELGLVSSQVGEEIAGVAAGTVEKDEDTKGTSRRADNAAPQHLGALRANETIVLTTAMLLSQTNVQNDDLLAVLNVESEHGTVTSLGEDMWLFVPSEGFEGQANITFDVTEGSAIYQHSVTADYEKTEAVISGSIKGDRIVGTTDDEDVVAFDGGDTVYSREGDDIVLGHAGDDVLIGGDGHDTIYGGEGDDQVFGRNGDDVLLGEAGNDTIYGGEGEDIVLGGDGNDLLLGEEGEDRLVGGDGDDTLEGGQGSDLMDGGAGNDEFRLSATELAGDIVQGGYGIDTLTLQSGQIGARIDLLRGTLSVDGDTAEVEDVENIFADIGDDEIIAGETRNVFSGGGGDDTFVFETTGSLINDGHARDLILDFDVGDRVDLSLLNLELGYLIGVGLHFAGLGRSTDLGALSYHFERRGEDEERTVVSARYLSGDEDRDDDSHYLAFELEGHMELDRSDFILTIEESQA